MNLERTHNLRATTRTSAPPYPTSAPPHPTTIRTTSRPPHTKHYTSARADRCGIGTTKHRALSVTQPLFAEVG